MDGVGEAGGEGVGNGLEEGKVEGLGEGETNGVGVPVCDGAGMVVSSNGLYCSFWSCCSTATKAPVIPPKAYITSFTAATPKL